MRRLPLLLLLAACSPKSTPIQEPGRPGDPAATPSGPTEPATAQRTMQPLAADTPTDTTAGNTFIAPAEWSLGVEGSATILQSPEADSWIALVDVKADSADQAVALAWAAYAKDKNFPLKVVHPGSDKDGWSRVATYEYNISPNAKRNAAAVRGKRRA